MAKFILAFVCCLLTPLCRAQESKSGKSAPADSAQILTFEPSSSSALPARWGGGPPGTVVADDQVVHSGHWSARLQRDSKSAGEFSTITKSLPINFGGKTIELRGFLRTEDVSNFVGLWLREDGDQPTLAFDNMEQRHVHGTTDWTQYSVVLPLHEQAKRLVLGVLLAGTGKAWADDLELLVDGKPIGEAQRDERPGTVLDTDDQFDTGSGIHISELNELQIGNLALLGKIWGFLKYYHPAVAAGQRHWDYDLLRILPAVLAAPDRASANTTLLRWIQSLGEVRSCNPCAKLKTDDLQLAPDTAWIEDKSIVGDADLSRALRTIRENRRVGKEQFYVSLVSNVRNPSFDHELVYGRVRFPDPGFQLLALYRFWNIIEYWYPYRDVLHEDWDKVLIEFIPRVTLAKSFDAYQLELISLSTRVHDGHANLWGSLSVRPPAGKCQLPVTVRFIANEPLPAVAGYVDDSGKDSGLMLGDKISEIDGTSVKKLVDEWKPYYNGSNDAAVLHDIAYYLPRGFCGETTMRVLRDKEELQLQVKRSVTPNDQVNLTHDLPGPAFRLLSNDVAYLKLSSVKAAEAAHYIESAAQTRGFIIDIRNYPSQFVPFAIGSLLVEQKTPFARFTLGDLETPGAFHWTPAEELEPAAPHYRGKVVIVVDDMSKSQSEYTAMAFRASPNSVVVGSTTAGADGNVSRIPLPGMLNGMISGIGVFYPDKRPTQRFGIVPDVEVWPTIAGIRDGRDEVLEEALRQILGPQTPLAEIERLAKP